MVWKLHGFSLSCVGDDHQSMVVHLLLSAMGSAMPSGDSCCEVTVASCRDVRAAVDMCHRDGSLKNAVAKDPAKYIHEVRAASAL